MPAVQDDRVAELVIRQGLLSTAQVDECRRLQSTLAQPHTLAQILVARRLVTADTLRGLMASAPASAGPAPAAPAGSPGPPGGAGDEVALGRHLMASGLISADQAREAYRLLLDYRKQYPSVTLPQVLVRHRMCEPEALRRAQQQFAGGAAAAPPPARPNPNQASHSQNPFFPPDTARPGQLAPPPRGADPRPGAGAPGEPRFGFQTLELEPNEPLRNGAGAPPLASAWDDQPTLLGGPRHEPAPGAGPAFGGDRPLVPRWDDAGPGRGPATGAGIAPPSGGGPAPAWNEAATFIDARRGPPPGPHGTHAGGLGPHGTHGGGLGPGGTHGGGLGPHGTHGGGLGPHGTHAGAAARGAPSFEPLGLAEPEPRPAAKGPAKPLAFAPGPDSADEDEDDEDDEDDDERADTNVESSTSFGGGRRRRGAPAARGGSNLLLLLGVGAVFLLLVSAGVWFALERRARSQAKQDFLTAYGERKEIDPEGLLEVARGLAGHAAGDPQFDDALADLERRVAVRKARADAVAILARLEGTEDLDQRLAICEEALAADPKFPDAYIERALVRYGLARREALKDDAADPRTFARAAIEDVNTALAHEETPRAHYVHARLLLAGGNDPSVQRLVLRDYKRVQEMDPEGALGALAKGREAVLNQLFDEAIAAFDQAVARAPTLLEGYLGRAEARLLKGDAAGALKDAQQAHGRAPRAPDVLTVLAEARYRASNDRTGALRDLTTALEIDPGHAFALALRAWVRLERNSLGDLTSSQVDIKSSERDAQRATRLHPDVALAHLALAEIARHADDYQQAQIHATQAVEKDRRLTEAYMFRGRLRMRAGELVNAFSDFTTVLRLEPDHARALTMKAAVHIEQGETELARTDLERAVQLDPTLAYAHFYLGRINLNANNQAKAIEHLSEAISLKADFGASYFYRACAFHDRQMYEESLRDLENAQRHGGEFKRYDVFLVRGHCHFLRNEWAEARQAFQEFLKTGNAPPGHPGIQKARQRLAECEQKLAQQK